MTTVAPDTLPAFSASTRLLVVAPHPDDETIATGLLVQRVRDAGGEVCILLLTAGDNNPWPQRWLERRWQIGAKDRQRWAMRRGGELQGALAALDIPPSALRALGWPDLGVTDMLMGRPDEAVATVTAAIRQFGPDLIAMPSLHDRHPDHSAAHVLVRLALADRVAPPALFMYLVHGQPYDGDCVRIEGTPGQLSAKWAALQAYRSQMALSSRRLCRLVERPERYVVQHGERHSSCVALPWQPPRCLQAWLQLGVVAPASARCWAWQDAPLRRGPDGRFELSLPIDQGDGPHFVRLSPRWSSPWIFDHWGWCELQAHRDSPCAAVAQADRPS